MYPPRRPRRRSRSYTQSTSTHSFCLSQALPLSLEPHPSSSSICFYIFAVCSLIIRRFLSCLHRLPAALTRRFMSCQIAFLFFDDVCILFKFFHLSVEFGGNIKVCNIRLQCSIISICFRDSAATFSLLSLIFHLLDLSSGTFLCYLSAASILFLVLLRLHIVIKPLLLFYCDYYMGLRRPMCM